MHDEVAQTLTGRRNGISFRLAEEVEVRLAEASPVTGGLVFQIMQGAAPPMRGARPQAGPVRRPMGRGRGRSRPT